MCIHANFGYSDALTANERISINEKAKLGDDFDKVKMYRAWHMSQQLTY